MGSLSDGRLIATAFITASTVWTSVACATPLHIAGLSVVPHGPTVATEMRYTRERGPTDGGRVQVFLRNDGPEAAKLSAATEITVGGATADELLRLGTWAWHDLPSAWPDEPLVLPPGALTVWSFNAAGGGEGVGTTTDLSVAGQPPLPLAIEAPDAWLSTVTFLRRAAAADHSVESVHPDTLVLHVTNAAEVAWTISACRLWTPQPGGSHRALKAGPWLERPAMFPADGRIAVGDQGGLVAEVRDLPLSFAAVELQLRSDDGAERTLWGHVRVKCERFVIGGGWLDGELPSGRSLHAADYLKTLRRMHVGCGMHGLVSGYSDDPERWAACPLESMSACRPFDQYDTDAVLPRVHAVEFLGEPQYGGGRPVPPQEVWRKLAPYQSTRLPTSVTHSEERIWRHYAGLSDHPHFDAYRVCAPAADAWQRYDRWGGEKIHWAAPLETVGDLTRSLRELNRPGPIAAWAQGPHHSWGPTGGRTRSSPTPDELRLQAWHSLSARITSLYWFNLGIKSVVKFRDLIDPITRVDREALVLAPLLLAGAAGRHERLRAADGSPDWDIATVCGPNGAVLFSLDLDYHPDPDNKTFVFGQDRAATWRFALPGYLGDVADVFRIDADGVYDARWRKEGAAVVVDGCANRVAVHVATADATLRGRLDDERLRLVAAERATGFDPAGDDDDFAALAALLEPRVSRPAESTARTAEARVGVVTSSADGLRRLTPGDDLVLGPVEATNAVVIHVEPATRGQSVLGLGGSFDHATCENLVKLPEDRQREVIASLFAPDRGIGMNLMRVCIGTSDFTGVPYYTYDDVPEGQTDPELTRFSIDKDRTHVLPMIKLARDANPDLLLFASPWSPPAWMKTSGKLGTGSVAREWYPAYARYLLAFVRAYEAEGLPIHAITVQNEPRMAHARYPTTLWTAVEQRDFIRDHLGPLFEREGVKTLVWCWDHNWNLPEFPRTILADPAAARFVDGTAFHHYEGRIEAQSALQREFPQKHLYFTEGSVFGVRGAAGLIDILRHSSRSYNAWVLMLDEHRRPNRGPHSASATCIELLDDGTVRTNFDYYMYGQFMKFIRRGAVRVDSSEPPGAPRNVVFLDPDGQFVLVAANTARSPVMFAVACGERMFSASLPARAVSTYRWPAAP